MAEPETVAFITPEDYLALERQPDNRWLLSETDERGAVIGLHSIGCELALAEVYDRVLDGT